MNKRQNSNTVPGSSPYAFWIGLPLMLLFVFAGLGGGSWALNRILMERTLYNEGKVTSGIVLQKKMSDTQNKGSRRTTYSVIYHFEVDSRTFTNDVRIESEYYFPLKNGGTIYIRYLPGDPDRNLPDGSHLSGLFMFFTGFGFIIGCGALVVVIGMTVDRVRKG